MLPTSAAKHTLAVAIYSIVDGLNTWLILLCHILASFVFVCVRVDDRPKSTVYKYWLDFRSVFKGRAVLDLQTSESIPALNKHQSKETSSRNCDRVISKRTSHNVRDSLEP
jgi:hypothetical protein